MPTFTARIGTESRKETERIFKDGGSQKNFIRKEFADKLKLPIIQSDQKLMIKGFLSENLVSTNIVEVTIEINDRNFNIPAICVQSID